MDIKNLRLLVVDDAETDELTIPKFIDLVSIKSGTENNTFSDPQINGWIQHCENLCQEKWLNYDLLTVDILFDKDPYDPLYGSLNKNIQDKFGKKNCSGLYHGMMALARRAGRDEYHNAIPLAWEVRSMSPDLLIAFPALEIEAIRAYGLMRSFLAEKEEGESLKKCLIREHLEFLGNKTILSDENEKVLRKGNEDDPGLYGWHPDEDDAGLYGLFKSLLETHPKRPGSARDAVERLLPQWRRRFRMAVKKRVIKLDAQSLKKQIRIIEDFSNAKNTSVNACLQDLYIPISDWESETHGIRLASIFADSQLFKECDFTKEENVEDTYGEKFSILSWVKEISNYTLNYERLRETATTFFRKDIQARASFWNNIEDMERCFIFCIALVRRQVNKNKDGFDTHINLALKLGIPAHERTFSRPFEKAGLSNCRKASTFKKKCERAFQGDIANQLEKPLVKEILIYCRDELKLEQKAIREKFPGFTSTQSIPS
ncbi:MAG: hypothetical protein K9L79_06655 [Methylobacter tundripaludum]|nr:hypothetical protein [Methylobacter tundripaludum]